MYHRIENVYVVEYCLSDCLRQQQQPIPDQGSHSSEQADSFPSHRQEVIISQSTQGFFKHIFGNCLGTKCHMLKSFF